MHPQRAQHGLGESFCQPKPKNELAHSYRLAGGIGDLEHIDYLRRERQLGL